MSWLVDTSVWSLAYRRDCPPDLPEVRALKAHLLDGVLVHSTGLIVLELLRGFVPGRSREVIMRQVRALRMIHPRMIDYYGAVDISNTCKAAGVQLGSVDSLIAQLCISRDLELLTTDRDFSHAAEHIPLRIWNS